MTFHDLHHDDLPLLLPNAWDVASGLAFADAGYQAIGTTSFGIAASSGHPDGARSTRDGTRTLARLLNVLPCYISADIEDGYDDDPANVADYVAGLGVAGINIEDSSDDRLVDPRALAAKVAAIKLASPQTYVNARVDTYWLGQDATVAASLERAEAYVEAGADGIFVPGATDPGELRDLAAALPVPLNVLVVPGLSLEELRDLGVRRVSTGSLPYRAALDRAVQVAAAARVGTAVNATSYPALQQWLVAFAQASAPGAARGASS